MSTRTQSISSMKNPISPIADGLHPVPENTFQTVYESALEVAPSEWSAPEVRYSLGGHGPEVFEKHDKPGTTGGSKRKLLITIAVLLALLIITAAVVGGVLGSNAAKAPTRDSEASDNSASEPSMVSSPTTSSSAAASSPTLKSIAPKSPLAVAPVYDSKTERYYLYLLFKSPDGKLGYVTYDTTLNAPGSQVPAYWGVPRYLDPKFPPSRDSHLSIASQESILTLFYTDSSSKVIDLSYDTTRDTPSEVLLRSDNIEKPELFVTENSAIGAYGPWGLYQGTDCTMQLYEGIRNCEGNVTQGAQLRVRIRTLCGTKLAVVPLTTSGIDVSMGIIALLYQDEAGKLVVTPLHEDMYNKPKGYRKPEIPKGSWTLNGFPDLEISEDKSFTAFAKKREGSDDSKTVSIFILYQDESGDIKQLSLENAESWRTSSPKALAGADAGTSITCTSRSSRTCRSEDWDKIGPSSSEELAEDLYRCYFWKNGRVVEVMLKGNDWIELGYVNLA